MRPSRGGHVHATEGTISRFTEGRTMLLRCESLRPPMSQSGQIRSFGDAGSMSGLAPGADIVAAFRHFRKVPPEAVQQSTGANLPIRRQWTPEEREQLLTLERPLSAPTAEAKKSPARAPLAE